MGVFADRGAVWAAVPNGNRIVRIDPATNAVVETVKLPYSPGGFMAAVEDAVWSAGGGCADLVARVDPPHEDAAWKQYEPHPVGLAFAFGTVWVAVLDSGKRRSTEPAHRPARRAAAGGREAGPARGRVRLGLGQRRRGRVLRIDGG